MRYSNIIVALIAIGTVCGCAPEIKVPDNFVSTGNAYNSIYDMRAVSADGVVIAARTVNNPKNGTLKFWTTAIQGELADSGHKLTDTKSVTSDSGVDGKLMTFSRRNRGQTFTYLVAVFIDGSRILVAEAGGEVEVYKAHEEDIESAMLSVR